MTHDDAEFGEWQDLDPSVAKTDEQIARIENVLKAARSRRAQKVICKVGFTGRVVREFEREVNEALEEGGFRVVEVLVSRCLFRFVCLAVLDQDA